MNKWLLLFIPMFIFLSSCEDKKNVILFNYKSMLKKSQGETIPVTIGKSIEMQGVVDKQGEFFYYSSDREMGNYDIYIRSLEDVNTVRLTSHPSRDYSPAISPNGKYLAFVSQREDPQGDIYLSKVKPQKILENLKADVDKQAKNLTIYLDKDGVVNSAKDATPVWSPDGDSLAYSSKKDGIENLWIMDDDGDNKRKITSKGGQSPAFSKNGNEIAFLTYRSNINGEIFTVNIKTKKEKKIISETGIVFNPIYGKTQNDIYYSLVDRDTNGDGTVDLNDNSVIMYINTLSNQGFRLTSYSEISFFPKWFSLRSKGMVLYSEQNGENIDVKIMHDTGIISKKSTVKNQYNLAVKYSNNKEKSLLAHEKVVTDYYNKNDVRSKYYVVKSLSKLVKSYGSKSKKGKNSLKKLQFLAKRKNQFAKFTLKNLREQTTKERDFLYLRYSRIFKVKKVKKRKRSIYPYFLEEQGKYFIETGRVKKGVSVLRGLLKKYPKYDGIKNVNYFISQNEIKTNKKDFVISKYDLYIMKKGYIKERSSTKKILLKRIFNISNKKNRLLILKKELTRYKKEARIFPMINYAIGKTYFQLNNKKLALSYLKLSKKKVRSNDIINYKVNTFLADYFIKVGNLEKAEKSIFVAIKNYIESWDENDADVRVKWLIDYYERRGKEYSLSNKKNKSLSLYKKYKDLMISLKNKKRYKEIYSKYGSVGHIYYIDAVIDTEGYNGLIKVKKEFEKRLAKARMDFDVAYIFGLAYINVKLAVIQESKSGFSNPDEITGLEGLTFYFNEAMEHINWALFLDEKFIDSYLLKSWIFQYLDLRRVEGGVDADKIISKYFPKFLLEENLVFLTKAIKINDENINRSSESKLHINLGNSYFILKNYPRSLYHYNKVSELGQGFNSKVEEAIFHFHNGYANWQNGNIPKARLEMKTAYNLYTVNFSNTRNTNFQKMIFYKYFAFFNRMDKDYKSAIKWYKKIISFSKKSRIRIDNARYYQEIATCNELLENYDESLKYLSKAKKSLKTYPDDDRNYKIKFSIFNFFSFKFYDLGSSSVVIGDTRLYTSLNKKEKNLLNLSIYESIYKKKKNYGRVTKYLNEKIKLLDEPKSGTENKALVRAYNNLGYYLFNARKYKESILSYQNSWEKASGKFNDPDGVLSAITNISEIYAYMIENEILFNDNTLKEISLLFGKIDKFKEDYEKENYEKQYAALKKEKKVVGLKPTEQESEALKEKIAKEALEKYYKVDISLGILGFYKAEILRKQFNEKNIQNATRFYEENKKVFDQYNRSIISLEAAYQQSANSNNSEMTVKLLLNSGICLSRIGDLKSANNKYLEAISISQKIKNSELLLMSYESFATFQIKYGKKIDKDSYLFFAKDYYKKAIAIVEKNPQKYSSSLERVSRIYKEYTNLLISTKSFNQAFHFSEKGYGVIRTILVQKTSPKFYSSIDNDAFYEYLKLKTTDIDKKLLEDEEYSKALLKRNNKLDKLYKNIYKKDSVMASFMKYKKEKYPEGDLVVYKFIQADDKLIAWKFENSKLTYEKLNNNSFESISKFINDGKKHRFIILNHTILKYLKKNSIDAKIRLKNFTFTPSLERVNNYMLFKMKPIRTIYNYNGLLKNKINNEMVVEYFGNKKDIDYGRYSLFVDSNKRNNQIDVENIFGSKFINAQTIVKSINGESYYDMVLFAEASIYRNINNVIFMPSIDLEKSEKFINKMSDENYSISSVRNKGFANSFSFGVTGQSDENKINNYFDKIKFENLIISGKYDLAKNLLDTWNNGQTLVDGVYFRYKQIILEIARGDFVKVNKLIKNYEKFSADDIRIKKIKSFIALSSGDISDAQFVLSSIETKDDIEISVLREILNLAQTGEEDLSKFIIKTKDSDKNDIGMDRLAILYSQYLVLFDKNEQAQKSLIDMNIVSPLSEKEMLFYSYVTGKKITDNENTISNSNISKFCNEKKIENIVDVLDESKNLAIYDYVLLIYIKVNNINYKIMSHLKNSLKHTRKQEDKTLSSLILYKQLMKKILFAGENKIVSDYYKVSLEKLEKFNIPVYKNILQFYYAEMNLNLNNYKLANSLLEKIEFTENSKFYLLHKLYLSRSRIETGSIDGAKSILVEIENNLKNKIEYSLHYALLQNRISYFDKSNNDLPNLEKKYKQIRTQLNKKNYQIKSRYVNKLFYTISQTFISVQMKNKRYDKALYYQEFSTAIVEKNRSNKVFHNSSLPLEKIQKKLHFKKKPLIVNIAKNGKDLFVWLIRHDYRKSFILKGGAEKLKNIAMNYRTSSLKLKPIYSISKKITSVFSPIIKDLNGSKNLIFILDQFSSGIPVEIIGSTVFLDEKHNVSFMSNLFKSLNFAGFSWDGVKVLGNSKNDIYKELEKVSIKESGIVILNNSKTNKAIFHSFQSIGFVNNSDSLFLSVNKLTVNSKTRGLYYFSDPKIDISNYYKVSNKLDGTKLAGFLYGAVLINDLNKGIFSQGFYDGIVKGLNPNEASNLGRKMVRQKKGFSHPAYWAGYRFYRNGL